MNFVLDNWYLIFIALASGGLLLVPTLKGAAAGGVSAAQAVQLINREKAVVIDVCEPEEYAAGHVGGAKNVPLAQLQERLPQVVKNKAVPVILVCAKGARATRAAAIAKSLGYDKAQPLAGGLAAWRGASMPVEKS
ncbi:rhodanese-like domain-containing protein [Pulveribacter suum]|uniref:Sulfurtransferase n=1 Tax=Pulveribacter suum TaxID=2116657 RepID=A0A2P1NJ56_9BURK|nr:rhodanese-like domain-containing protein [Pulveribacter suum]AVP57062.1 sulfurtransferase [Pulveribacter suum]